jgi:hypothetical protein
MSKTPLQQLIDILQQDLDRMPNPSSDKAAALYYCQAVAKSLLPTEREVIEAAYDSGVLAQQRLNNGCDYVCQSVYFTTKFNDNGISKEA